MVGDKLADKIEAIMLATGETLGLAGSEEVAILRTCARAYTTQERRIMVLRRIERPLWDGLKNVTNPFFHI